MNDLLKVLSTIAPTLATAFGGPLAGLAVEALGSALGIATPTHDSVTEALKGPLTTEQVVAIKMAEKDLEVRLKELDIKLEDIAANDRVSARTLFAQGYKLIGGISILTIAGFFGSVYWVLHGGLFGLSEPEILLVGTVIGYMANNTQQVYSYFFGTSSGSDKKNDMLSAVIKR